MFGPKLPIFLALTASALLGCEKADSRTEDPQLTALTQSLKTEPWTPEDRALCEAFRGEKEGFIAIQEIKKEHSLTLGFRFSRGEKGTNTRFALDSVRIATKPKQIAWHARLEEEIESWNGVIQPTERPDQIGTLMIGQGPDFLGPQARELKVFLHGVETGLGALETLRALCTSETKSPGKEVIRLKLSNERILQLEAQGSKAAQLSDEKRRFRLQASKQGIQWISESDSPKTMIRVLAVDSSIANQNDTLPDSRGR